MLFFLFLYLGFVCLAAFSCDVPFFFCNICASQLVAELRLVFFSLHHGYEFIEYHIFSFKVETDRTYCHALAFPFLLEFCLLFDMLFNAITIFQEELVGLTFESIGCLRYWLI